MYSLVSVIEGCSRGDSTERGGEDSRGGVGRGSSGGNTDGEESSGGGGGGGGGIVDVGGGGGGGSGGWRPSVPSSFPAPALVHDCDMLILSRT